MTLKSASISEVDVDLNSRGSAAPDNDALKAEKVGARAGLQF